ncbi:MAG: lysylphosphatidylglycerol synthase transmembrane domain-containing protein [Marmoricola sp.]
MRRVLRWRWLVRVAGLVALGLLVIEAYEGWPSIAADLKRLPVPVWGWFALAILADVASMGTYARLQRRLLSAGGTSVSLPNALALAYASHSLSDTLPGGPLFSTVFSFRRMRTLGAPAAVASWVIALSGVLSSAALIVIGVVAGLLATGSTDGVALLCYAVIAAALIWSVRAVRRQPDLVVAAVLGSLRGVNRVLRRDPRRGSDRIEDLVAELTAVRIGGRNLAIVWAQAIANWLLDGLCLYLCLLAVGVTDASPVAVILAYTAGMAALSVPFVPAGLGVVDGALILGLIAGGTGPAKALAATVLFRLITLGMIVGIGWVVWFFIRTPKPTESSPRSPGMQ